MKIAIVGANGFLGRKLSDYFSQSDEVLNFGVNQSDNIVKLDATKKQEVEVALVKFKPDIVVDTVALSSSVACEKNPDLCMKMNYETAKNIAEVCKNINADMVFISSSYLFDGEKGDYNEEDVLMPTNEYAKAKIMAENVVSELNNFIIIRVEMMFGVHKGKIRFATSTFEKELIEVGYPNQLRNPLFIDDVPKIIDSLIKLKQKGIFHIGGPDKVTMLEFLTNLAKLENAENKIKVVDSSGWLVKSPKKPTLSVEKINSLGIKTTNIRDAFEDIKKQLSKN